MFNWLQQLWGHFWSPAITPIVPPAPPPPEQPPARPPDLDPPGPGYDFAAGNDPPALAELYERINEDRLARALVPLKADARLMRAALGHARWMVLNNKLDHGELASAQATPALRARSAGYRAAYVGEVIAYGYPRPEAVLAGWLASPGHKAVLTAIGARDVGLAVDFDRYGRAYWCVVVALSSLARVPTGSGLHGHAMIALQGQALSLDRPVEDAPGGLYAAGLDPHPKPRTWRPELYGGYGSYGS